MCCDGDMWGALFGGGPYDHKFAVWRVLKGAPLVVVNMVSAMCNALRCVIRRDCIITIVLVPLNSNVLLLLPIFSHSPVRLTPRLPFFAKLAPLIMNGISIEVPLLLNTTPRTLEWKFLIFRSWYLKNLE